MSLLFITDHDEIIYDAIESRKPKSSKPARQTNYANPAFKSNNAAQKKSHATMGPAEYLPPNPQEYLRKNSKKITHSIIKQKPKSNKFERQCCRCTAEGKKPSVPREDSQIIHRNKNFIKDNMKKVIDAKPRKPKENYVLTNRGDKVDAHILEPRFATSKGFGKYPRYLLQHQHNIGKFLQSIKDEEEMNKISHCRYISRQERDSLLHGLKQNWDSKQKEFQLLPMITDTIPKRNRKLKIENELKSLEKDILLIEKHPYIYVLKDDN